MSHSTAAVPFSAPRATRRAALAAVGLSLALGLAAPAPVELELGVEVEGLKLNAFFGFGRLGFRRSPAPLPKVKKLLRVKIDGLEIVPGADSNTETDTANGSVSGSESGDSIRSHSVDGSADPLHIVDYNGQVQWSDGSKVSKADLEEH